MERQLGVTAGGGEGAGAITSKVVLLLLLLVVVVVFTTVSGQGYLWSRKRDAISHGGRRRMRTWEIGSGVRLRASGLTGEGTSRQPKATGIQTIR
jgi:hypothetical protein